MAISQVLSAIRYKGPLSRAELARLTGLSKPTVSNIVRDLLEARLVVEQGHAASDGGRPAMLVGFNERAGFVLGIDLGGTTIRAVLTDLEGNQLAALREPTVSSSAAELVNQVVRLAGSLAGAAGIQGDDILAAAIGTPGAVDPATGIIRYAPNLPVLEEPAFLTGLQARLGGSLSVHNDVNLAAVGEQWKGAGSGISSFAFVSIGTGLGVGIIADGALQIGAHGRSGELGYLRLEPSSRQTLEDVLSGPGIARAHAAAGGSGDSHDAFDEADAGTGVGVGVVADLLPRLAWMCSSLATLLDPEVIVLGGGIGLRFGAHLDELSDLLKRASPIVPELVVSHLGDDAGLTGAVSMGLRESQRLILHRIGGGQETLVGR